MGAPRKLPPDSTLLEWVDEGLTHQEIADRTLEKTGKKVTREGVTLALNRLGVTPSAPRYRKEIPWRIHPAHNNENAVRMLRLLGRRRNKKTPGVKPLTEDEGRQLDRWLEWLAENDCVVAYCYEYSAGRKGFYYVRRDEREDGPPHIPVRPRTIEVDELPDELQL